MKDIGSVVYIAAFTIRDFACSIKSRGDNLNRTSPHPILCVCLRCSSCLGVVQSRAWTCRHETSPANLSPSLVSPSLPIYQQHRGKTPRLITKSTPSHSWCPTQEPQEMRSIKSIKSIAPFSLSRVADVAQSRVLSFFPCVLRCPFSVAGDFISCTS